jgi:hypothetical protein
LERDLGGKFRRLNEFNERVFLFKRSILRQSPSRLAHQPNWRVGQGTALNCIKKPLAVRHGNKVRSTAAL